MGFMWMMGVVGVFRLHDVVKTFDYMSIWCVSIGGTICLIGTVHFTGNIPKECGILVERLNFSYERNFSSRQRKIFRKDVLSLRIFGQRCDPIRLLKHNAMYHYFGGMIDFIITFLVAYPELGKA
jgi:predicted membrane channel-forming protein YqfA (hemolysin III family)